MTNDEWHKMMAGRDAIQMVALERSRQEQKWSSWHDDLHVNGELALAASDLLRGVDDGWGLRQRWQNDRVHQLAVAGALVLAEIDRELRKQARGELRREESVKT